jgi:hypothetical protein
MSDDFLLWIPDLNITQKIQTVLPPEVIADPVYLGLGNRTAKYLPDRYDFSRLIIDMKLQQNLYNYKVLVDWMKLYGTYNEADPDNTCMYKDIYVIIINSLDNLTPIAYIKYTGCFPVGISNPSFDPTSTSVMRITVNFEVQTLDITIV